MDDIGQVKNEAHAEDKLVEVVEDGYPGLTASECLEELELVEETEEVLRR
jgi:hypothetical protein